MKKWARFIWCFSFLALASPSAYGQQIGIHNCDKAAAHAADPQKVGPGLPDKDVDPARAITACSNAVLKNPEIARFHFQLGRAYWLSQQYKEAVEHFRQAAEMRYLAAAAYLGEAFEKGLGGLKKDSQKAKKHYERAIAGKFTPAELLLANLVKARHDADQKSVVTVPLEPILTPRPSIWEHGIPDHPPQLDRILLTGETLALLVLNNRPTVDSTEVLQFLIERQVAYDRAYYKRLSLESNGLEWGLRWDPKTSKGYHPLYIPFCPADFFPEIADITAVPEDELAAIPDPLKLITSDPAAMELFKAWILKRAEMLPGQMVIPGQFQPIDYQSIGKQLIFREFGLTGGDGPIQDDVFSLFGYARSQIQRYRGKEMGMPAAVLLPNVKRMYHPHISPELNNRQRESLFEIESGVKKVELSKAGPYDAVVLIHLEPTRIRLFSPSDHALVHEELYQVAALDKNQITQPAASFLPMTVGGESPMFTAEIADLMVAKFVPEALDRGNLERMFIARWEYEQAMAKMNRDVQGGAYFIEGKPRPDKAQRASMLEPFKRWILARAKALSSRTIVNFDQWAEDDNGRIILPKGRSKKEEGTFHLAAMSCAQKCESTLCSREVKRQCSALADAIKSPSPYVYPPPVHPRESKAGPRIICAGQDYYCMGSAQVVSKEIGLEHGIDLNDVLLLDKQLAFPGDRKEVWGLQPGKTIQLEIEVTGVERRTKRPLDAAEQAYGKVEGHMALLRTSGKYYLFKSHVVGARVVGEGIGEVALELRDFPSPNALANTLSDQNSPAFPKSEFDVVGLKLGMKMVDAERLIRRHMSIGRTLRAEREQKISSATGNFEPFSSGRIYISRDNNEFIALYDEPPSAEGIVVGIMRELNIPKGKTNASAVLDQLEKKYGQKVATQGETVGWGAAPPDQIVNCLTYTGSFFMNWSDSSGARGKWRPISSGHDNFISGLQPMVGLPIAAGCGPIISASFDSESATDFDILTVRLVDYGSYSDLYVRSSELTSQKPSSIPKSATGLDLRF